MFYKLSPESVHYRFFRMLKSMPHEKLQEFLRVDYDADMALVAQGGRDDGSPITGIAHYSKDPRTNIADAAFLIIDECQGRGLGTILLNTLVDAARARGVAGFCADVLANNQAMIRVFHKCGYPVESKLEEGVYHLNIPFVEKRARKRRRSKPKATSAD